METDVQVLQSALLDRKKGKPGVVSVVVKYGGCGIKKAWV